MVLVLTLSSKICCFKSIIISLECFILSILCFQIYILELYKIYDGILFSFYISTLAIYSVKIVIDIIIGISFIRNINNVHNLETLQSFQENNCLTRNKIKNILYILLFILDSILGIIFYASGIINNISIYATIQLIVITGIPFIFMVGLLLLCMFSVVRYSDYYIEQIRNYVIPTNESIEEINNNRIMSIENNNTRNIIQNRINYNINIIIPSQVADEVIRRVEGKENIICSICLDDNKLNNDWSELMCKHNYHSICIEKWLVNNTTCPLCRQDILREVCE